MSIGAASTTVAAVDGSTTAQAAGSGKCYISRMGVASIYDSAFLVY